MRKPELRKKPLLIGKRTGKSTAVWVVAKKRLRGPWTLQAMVTSNR